MKVDNNLIKKFRDILLEEEYDFFYQRISGIQNYFYNPWQTEEVVRANLKELPDRLSNLYMFLLLGDSFPKSTLDHSYNNLATICLELGIAVEQNGLVRLNNYSLISYQGCYFLVNTLFSYKTCLDKNSDVYIGIDTYRLTNILPKNIRGDVLDLCSGSGIQGILSSFSNQSVDLIEYNKNAVPITLFNTYLNNVQEKVHVFHSDLYREVSNKTYDLIISNPPFIPVPEGIEYPICGDGGEDGLYLIRKIIEGFDKHLNDKGKAIIIGECIGDSSGRTLLFDNVLKNLDDKYAVKLILDDVIPVEIQAKSVVEVTSNIYGNIDKSNLESKWLDMYKKIGVSHYYIFTLIIEKNSNNIKKNTKKVLFAKKFFTKETILSLKGQFQFNVIENIYEISSKLGGLACIDSETKDFLESLNGKKSLEELIDFTKCDPKHYHDIITTCMTLEESGVIERRKYEGI